MQNTNSFAPDDSTRSTTQGKSAKNILPIEEKNQVPPDVNLFHLVAKVCSATHQHPLSPHLTSIIHYHQLSSTLVDQAVAPDPETTKVRVATHPVRPQPQPPANPHHPLYPAQNTLTRLHTVLPEAFKHATNSHKDVEDAKDAVSAYMRLVDYLLLLARCADGCGDVFNGCWRIPATHIVHIMHSPQSCHHNTDRSTGYYPCSSHIQLFQGLVDGCSDHSGQALGRYKGCVLMVF